MRILVIGGTNFMGPYVVRELVAQGHQLAVFHRGKTPTPQEVQEIFGDRRHLSEYADTLAALHPDVVLDMVPMLEQDARQVMSIFKGAARRVVAISSQDVYRAFGRVNLKEAGPVEDGPLTEDSPLRENLYPYRAAREPDDPRKWMDDYDKILVERVVMSDAELPGTVLRLPAVYGPGDYQHRLFAYVKRMVDGRPAILLDETVAQWKWTQGYVENVTAAIALAVVDERAAGRIYNVGEPFALTVQERIRKVAEVLDWHGQILMMPPERLPETLRWDGNAKQHIVVDSSRIRHELGYQEHVGIDESFARAVQWERTHPPEHIKPEDFDYQQEDESLSER